MAASKEITRKDADKPVPAEKTVTVQGMKVTVSTAAMKQLDVIEALDDVSSGRNQFAIITAVRSVFGEDQYADVKKHLENKHDAVELDHLMDFFEATLKKAAPNS